MSVFEEKVKKKKCFFALMIFLSQCLSLEIFSFLNHFVSYSYSLLVSYIHLFSARRRRKTRG